MIQSIQDPSPVPLIRPYQPLEGLEAENSVIDLPFPEINKLSKDKYKDTYINLDLSNEAEEAQTLTQTAGVDSAVQVTNSKTMAVNGTMSNTLNNPKFASAEDLERYAQFLESEIARLKVERQAMGPGKIDDVISAWESWLSQVNWFLDGNNNHSIIHDADGKRYVHIGESILDPEVRNACRLPADWYSIYGINDYLEFMSDKTDDNLDGLTVGEIRYRLAYAMIDKNGEVAELNRIKNKFENLPWYDKIPFAWIDYLVDVARYEKSIQEFDNRIAILQNKLLEKLGAA